MIVTRSILVTIYYFMLTGYQIVKLRFFFIDNNFCYRLLIFCIWDYWWKLCLIYFFLIIIFWWALISLLILIAWRCLLYFLPFYFFCFLINLSWFYYCFYFFDQKIWMINFKIFNIHHIILRFCLILSIVYF